MHWAQLLLCHPGDVPVILMRQYGGYPGRPLSMVLHGIILVPLGEDLRDANLALLSPFYANDAAFNGSAMRSET